MTWKRPHPSEVHAVLFNPQGGVTNTQTVWASTKVTENAYDPSAAMDGAGNFVIGCTRGGNDMRGTLNGQYVAADGPTSVWASAYKNTGALQQAGIDLSANSLEAPPVPAKGAQGPYFLNDYRPSVALSSSGHLVAGWVNYGLTSNGGLTGTAVFSQTFVNAPFQYQLKDGLSLIIAGGKPTTYPIAITRDPGFSGPINITLSQLPAGVSAAYNADSPAASEVRTITFTSKNSVPASGVAAVLKISGGGVDLTPTLDLSATPSLITGWTSTAGSTLVKGFAVTIFGSGFLPSSTVQFGSPAAAAVPTSISPDGISLQVTVPMNAVAGPITIVRPGADPIVSAASAQYTAGQVVSLGNNFGYAPGYNAAFLNMGNQVDVYGYGFQPGARVIFGDPGTTDPSQLKSLADQVAATPTAISADGTVLHVNVPRYAVDGPVVVVEPDGTGLPSAVTFHVSNYRNTCGFSFHNFDFDVTWDMMKNEFGAAQVDALLPYTVPTWRPPFIETKQSPAPPAVPGLDRIALPPMFAPPAIPRSTAATSFAPSHGDVALQVAQARVVAFTLARRGKDAGQRGRRTLTCSGRRAAG